MGDCAPFHGTRNIVAVDDSPELEEHRVVSKWQTMYRRTRRGLCLEAVIAGSGYYKLKAPLACLFSHSLTELNHDQTQTIECIV